MFIKLECKIRPGILLIGIKYSMRDRLCDVFVREDGIWVI